MSAVGLTVNGGEFRMSEPKSISSEDGQDGEYEDISKFVDSPDIEAKTYAEDHKNRNSGTFSRALDESFIDRLRCEAKKAGWWADVLADPGLLIAVRGSYLNVYWQGQSIFYVENRKSGLNVTTHEKFLIDPQLRSQVSLLTNGEFSINNLRMNGIISQYNKETLGKIKLAASYFSALEKIGCHNIAKNNNNFIDCEIALPEFTVPATPASIGRGRIDIACIEECGNNNARLVFWEAKHFRNPGLRARSPALAGVHEQINRYRTNLAAREKDILASYTSVARNFLAFKKMGWCRDLSPLIDDVASERRNLVIGKAPKVGLLIFGFDTAQRDHASWQSHLGRLTPPDIDEVIALQDARCIKL